MLHVSAVLGADQSSWPDTATGRHHNINGDRNSMAVVSYVDRYRMHACRPYES